MNFFWPSYKAKKAVKAKKAKKKNLPDESE